MFFAHATDTRIHTDKYKLKRTNGPGRPFFELFVGNFVLLCLPEPVYVVGVNIAQKTAVFDCLDNWNTWVLITIIRQKRSESLQWKVTD